MGHTLHSQQLVGRRVVVIANGYQDAGQFGIGRRVEQW